MTVGWGKLPCHACLSEVDDDIPVRAVGLGGGAVAEELVVFRDLLTQKLFLVVAGHPNPLEGAVRHDDAVPGAAGHFRREEFSPLTGKILFASDEEPRVGIQLHKLSTELF